METRQGEAELKDFLANWPQEEAALKQAYAHVDDFELIDYRVRILDQGHGTDAIVRTLIDTTDGERTWTTVGASTNIIEASWIALSESVEYYILTDAERNDVQYGMPELVARDD